MRVNGQVDSHILGFFGGPHGLAVGGRPVRVPVRLQGLADQAHVQVESDAGDVAGLLAAQEVARTSDLKVVLGDRQARAQLVVRGDRRQPVVSGLGQRHLRWVEEVGVAALPASPHPATQLVQLGQPEGVGTIDDQSVGVGDVQAGLHDGRAHEDIELVVPEPLHGGLQQVLGHLPVRDHHPRLGHQLTHPGGGRVDRADPVVHVERLPVAQQLPAQRRGDLLVVVRSDVGQDRVSLLGRRQDG